MKNEERRKLWLYLYPDEPHQKAAIDAIEKIPLRQRADYFRDCLVAGMGLSALDKRLPTLLSILLDGKNDGRTLKHTLSLILPEMATDSTAEKPVAVAWQRRGKNVLIQGSPWSEWFPVSEEEYKKHFADPDDNTQVRALFAFAHNEQKNESAPDIPAPENETLANAKKLFSW